MTTSRLNFVSFEVEIKINLHDMEVVAPLFFDKNITKDIHDKIGTNKCNKFDRIGGDLIKKDEKALTGFVLMVPERKPLHGPCSLQYQR